MLKRTSSCHFSRLLGGLRRTRHSSTPTPLQSSLITIPHRTSTPQPRRPTTRTSTPFITSRALNSSQQRLLNRQPTSPPNLDALTDHTNHRVVSIPTTQHISTIQQLSQHQQHLIQTFVLPEHRPETAQHLTSFQRRVVVPAIRSLILSIKSLTITGLAVFGLSAMLNVYFSTKHLYTNLKAIHPELFSQPMTTQKLQLLSLILADDFRSTLSQIFPSFVDLKFKLYKMVYLPLKRVLNKYLPHLQSQPVNNQLTARFFNLLSNTRPKHDPYQTHLDNLEQQKAIRTCVLTGHKSTDISAIQHYAMGNIASMEASLRDLEALHDSIDTIYSGSFNNMLELHQRVGKQRALLNVIKSLPNHTIEVDLSVHCQTKAAYFGKKDYFTNSSATATSPQLQSALFDHRGLEHTHIFDILSSGLPSGFFDKFQQFPTFHSNQLLDDHLQVHLFNIYNYYLGRLPHYQVSALTDQREPISMYFDMNIRNFFNTTQPSFTQSQRHQGSESSQMDFPLQHRQLESITVSIHNQADQLSKSTLTQDPFHRHQLPMSLSNLLDQLELPTNIRQMIEPIMTQQLHTQQQQQQQQQPNKFTYYSPNNILTHKSEFDHLAQHGLSQLPSLQSFSVTHKNAIQQHLAGIIDELKSQIMLQYDLHYRSLSNIADSDTYYAQSIAHLTYNIALVERAQTIKNQFVSFLSPLYLISHPLYFTTIAKQQYSPDLRSTLDRFTIGLHSNAQGTQLSFGHIPFPFIAELGRVDSQYTSSNAPLLNKELQPRLNLAYDNGRTAFQDDIFQTATQYASKSSLLYNYKQQFTQQSQRLKDSPSFTSYLQQRQATARNAITERITQDQLNQFTQQLSIPHILMDFGAI